MRKVRISFLHLAPVPYDVEHNRGLVESALRVAAGQGADWVITPELCVSGYLFEEQIGTDWILSQPDAWTQDICRLVKEQSLTMFLAQPERDQESGKYTHTVFVINHLGEITGNTESSMSCTELKPGPARAGQRSTRRRRNESRDSGLRRQLQKQGGSGAEGQRCPDSGITGGMGVPGIADPMVSGSNGPSTPDYP